MSYDAERLEEAEIASIGELDRYQGRPGVLWVDVAGFGDERVLRHLGERFAIHPLAMADAVNVPQRPKVEDYADRHLVVTRMARLGEQEEVDLEQVSFVLGPGWVCSFQERPGDVLEPVRERLRTNGGVVRRMGADYLVTTLLAAVIDGYFPVVEAVGELLDRLEEQVMEAPTRSTLHQIHGVRRLLIALHRIQWRQRDALGSMLRDETSPVSAPVRPYLRDVYDHSVQVLDTIETSRDLAVGLLDVYLSTVSNRMNEVMKTLTVIATVFIPLSFLVGVYGMNFEYMPELRWRWAYPLLWTVMIGVATTFLLWFRRRGWIGGSQDGQSGDSAAGAKLLGGDGFGGG